MPEKIDVPSRFKRHWGYKIYDNEEIEPPHVTINGTGGDVWRWKLREKDFFNEPPPPRKLPKEIRDDIPTKWDEMSYKWNKLHPDNPVEMTDEQIDSGMRSSGIDENDIEEEREKLKKLMKEKRLF